MLVLILASPRLPPHIVRPSLKNPPVLQLTGYESAQGLQDTDELLKSIISVSVNNPSPRYPVATTNKAAKP